LRSFIAIQISDLLIEYVSTIKEKLEAVSPDVKWVEHDNYHITLKYLGDVNTRQINSIKEQLTIVGDNCPQFRLQLKGLGFFPSKTRPRVVWLGIQGEIDKAYFLADRIDAYLAPLGFEPEQKRSFHLTMGRIRSDARINQMMEVASTMQDNIKDYSFMVKNFKLMESQLSVAGPTYTVIKSFPLLG